MTAQSHSGDRPLSESREASFIEVYIYIYVISTVWYELVLYCGYCQTHGRSNDKTVLGSIGIGVMEIGRS